MSNSNLTIRNSTAEFLIFTRQAGGDGIEVCYQDGSIWLTQKLMAELFDTERSVIAKHLKNIFARAELDKNAVCANFAHTAADGKNYNTQFKNIFAGDKLRANPVIRKFRITASDGKLANASMPHLNRRTRPTATPATAGVQSL